MKYPEGKIAIQVTPAKDCFVATARVYPKYSDLVESYLAEATASRRYLEDKPSVSPREWAQTAAVGIALRNAGFSLQFSMVGEDFEKNAHNELVVTGNMEVSQTSGHSSIPSFVEQSQLKEETYTAETVIPKELKPEERLQQELAKPCPIKKYIDKTLGKYCSLILVQSNGWLPNSRVIKN